MNRATAESNAAASVVFQEGAIGKNLQIELAAKVVVFACTDLSIQFDVISPIAIACDARFR